MIHWEKQNNSLIVGKTNLFHFRLEPTQLDGPLADACYVQAYLTLPRTLLWHAVAVGVQKADGYSSGIAEAKQLVINYLALQQKLEQENNSLLEFEQCLP